MPVKGFAFTMYPVSDMPRALAFYTGVLGLKQAGLESESWVEFDLNGCTFGVGNFQQVGTPGSAQSLAIEVSDIASFRAALSERGIESMEPHESPICWIGMVRDPDGNQIWLHQAK